MLQVGATGINQQTNQQGKSPDKDYSIMNLDNGRWCITLRIAGFLDFVHRPVF
jgi:hypothetical protein